MTRINRHRRSLPRSICRLPQDSFPHLASIHPGCRAIRAPFEPKRSRFQSVPTPSTTDPFSVPYLNTFGGPFINTLNNRPTSPYNHHCSGAVALLPPVRRSSFPSPFRIRSCTRTKNQEATIAIAHDDGGGGDGGRPRNRCSSFLPACLSAAPPQCSVSEVRGEAGREQKRREYEERREPPINSHVYLDLKVGASRRTTDRPRCRVSRVHALTSTPSIEGGRESGPTD